MWEFPGEVSNSAGRRFLTDQPSLTVMSHEKEPGLVQVTGRVDSDGSW